MKVDVNDMINDLISEDIPRRSGHRTARYGLRFVPNGFGLLLGLLILLILIVLVYAIIENLSPYLSVLHLPFIFGRTLSLRLLFLCFRYGF